MVQKLRIVAAAVLLLTLSISFTSCQQSQEEKNLEQPIPPLLERKGDLAKAAEWPKTKADADALREKIAQKPEDIHARLQLAMLYMTEVRITGEGNYYYQAIVKVLNSVLDQDPRNFEANVFKASVAMSQHQFAQAKDIATRALAINPYNGYVYGVLVDANVELGDYQQAVAMSDKMQAIHPSLESYARASYLREIYGDYAGAKEAMLMAAQAGPTGTENAEWARCILGDLYLATGNPDSAAYLYNVSLQVRPNYTNALIGLAKVEKARKDYPAAIAHVRQAIGIMSETAYIVMLAELYDLNGDKDKAADTRQDVIDLLVDSKNNEPASVEIKHHADRELAQAYLAAGQLDNAAKYAALDLAVRPNNIDANELMAWILYKQGKAADAVVYADRMLATGTKSAEKLYKAGTIYNAAGNVAKGDPLLQEARTINPYLDQRILVAAK